MREMLFSQIFPFGPQSNYASAYARITYAPHARLRRLRALARKRTGIAPCRSQFGRVTTHNHEAFFPAANAERKIGSFGSAGFRVVSGESLNSFGEIGTLAPTYLPAEG